MASQLLSASRAGAIKSTPDFQTISLHHVVRSCIATFVPIASVKNVEITFEPCDKCTISGDEEGIRALMNNLMDNAVRHTPPGGKVNISLCKQDGKAVLKVTDTGSGIAEAEKNKIFQRFYRVPGTSLSGAGLGLSIVKDVANNHGAVVTVANGPHNVGTTFCIVFRFQFLNIAV
jgi:signal transduction histidine kinase